MRADKRTVRHVDHTNQNKDDDYSHHPSPNVVEHVVRGLLNDGHIEQSNSYEHEGSHCVGPPKGKRYIIAGNQHSELQITEMQFLGTSTHYFVNKHDLWLFLSKSSIINTKLFCD